LLLKDTWLPFNNSVLLKRNAVNQGVESAQHMIIHYHMPLSHQINICSKNCCSLLRHDIITRRNRKVAY
jgi:hypothetical protein